MTIYLSILKEFLIKNIINWQKKSIARDQNPLNAIGSFFNASRNLTLSEYKRAVADELMKNLQKSKASATDVLTLKAVEELLTDAKKTATEAAKKNQCNLGTFPTMTDQTYNIAKCIYEQFKEVKFLDIEFSNDPFDIYRYYLSAYLAQKVYDTYHPKLTDNSVLTQEREELIKRVLEDCIKTLERLDKTNRDYLDARKDTVLKSIATLRRENENLCVKHGVQLVIPVLSIGIASLNVGMPPLQPDNGCIETCMISATEMINKIKVVIEVVEPQAKKIDDFFIKIPTSESTELDNQLNPNL